MTREEKIAYWLKSAETDWTVAEHLVEKRDYSYALFFGHLHLEKLLKAVFVYRYDEVPPFTHRLPFLAERAGLILSEERLELLETVTDFNLEARYPDEKFSFQQKCTTEFTAQYLDKIKEMASWLRQQLP
ncbi:HEPN domain-containing protein [Trichloromonas acetexigens]|jgi:HEPN domain-containing protein|uniref:HEPN domain-containing protein n=1 Tax=Trichloromonas acetexigens TaxID=38815 RepID=A0A550J6G0_9BACT|nr:HEPN domain-containing protein [Desulfuromonas acetexigens]TRO78819.1 HEPN domain-containing protein [Desulfuromonas acetexigens]